MNNSLAYIETRWMAYASRMHGEIGRALDLEEQADRLMVTLGNDELEADCDELACNPGTIQADWAALMETVAP